MPADYTIPVKEGLVTTLCDFALRCVREMVEYPSSLDDVPGSPAPERFEPLTGYCDERIAEAQAMLTELPGLSVEECDRRAAAEQADIIERQREAVAQKKKRINRCQTMRDQLIAWHPPEEFAALYDFMLTQLTRSIDLDYYMADELNEPVKFDAEQWRRATLARAAHDLEFHTDARRQYIERTENRNRWLMRLRASLER